MYQLISTVELFVDVCLLHLMKLRSRSPVGLALKAFLARSRHNKDLFGIAVVRRYPIITTSI